MLGVTHSTDQRTGAVDRIPASHWSDKLHSKVISPLPRDRAFWAVTFEDGALELRYSHDHWHYVKQHVWQRTDGESGEWEADDIAGWTDDYEDAEEAAALLGEPA